MSIRASQRQLKFLPALDPDARSGRALSEKHMLKGLASHLTPDLIWALAAMGHGDTIAVVDANYPAYALHNRVLPLSGLDTISAIEAILKVFPVDDSDSPAAFRMVPESDEAAQFPVHSAFAWAVSQAEGREVPIAPLPRRAFYTRARDAFAVVLTSDATSYACFLVTKGVVASSEIEARS
jgi:L-fucose mutarotase